MVWRISRYGDGSFVLKVDSQSTRVIGDGFVVVGGRGDRVNFWTNIRVEGLSLKEAFPRCFSLAIDSVLVNARR